MSAPTLEWLRALYRRRYYELARSLANSIVVGVPLYTVEEVESTIVTVEARYPWMRLTSLQPWGHEPQPDSGIASFECPPDDALAAGLLTAAMLPQGRKRMVWTSDINVRKSSGHSIEVVIEAKEGAVPDTHPLSMFLPSVIRRARPVTMPVRGELRLVVDNTRVLP